ncbi:MAG: response regulator, partial [Ignavibacteriaceae bacterium]
MAQKKILWVDDEIDLLRSHIIFLTEKGYDVSTNTNGEDALVTLKEKEVDLIFLDEMMPGMGGLQLLGKIKELHPNIPVVMVTKSEAESLMDEAIGGKIKDYLTKPVNPSQVLLVCKKILEGKRISTEMAAKDYLQDFNQISTLLQNQLSYSEWIELYLKLVHWDLELSSHKENNLLQTLADQKKEANKEFSKYVERHYKTWVNSPSKEDRPELTVEIV